MFTAEATGTQPLNYQWEWKSAMDDGEWQPCDVERFPGAMVVVPSVQKGAIVVLSATVLIPTFPIQLNVVLVIE